jgi:hypothetical protein
MSGDDQFGRWDLPYEDVPDGPVEIDVEALFVDGLTVRAAVHDFPAPVGALPLLIFDFTTTADPDLRIPPIALVGTPDTLRSVADIVRKAANGAVCGHRRRNGRST